MSLQFWWVMEKLQRRFGVGIGAWLLEAASEEGRTRGFLARGLCEFADWRNARGDLCLASALSGRSGSSLRSARRRFGLGGR